MQLQSFTHTHTYIHTHIYLDLPGMRFFCSFAKRQKFLPDFSRIAFCLQNRLSGNHETETALTKLLHQTRVDLYTLPSYFSICVLVCRNYPTTFLGLSESNKYPNKFLCLHNYISNQDIPVECLLYQNQFMFLSSPITHRLVAIARVCSGMNMLELALDGLNWNMFLPQWEIMHQQKLWWDKVAFGSRKVAVGSGKVARAVFSFFFWLHTSRKDILNSSKTQLKGIPTSFPILAGEIQMTMPGPNALHWPQSKIQETKDIYISGKKVWTVLLPCVVVKRFLCSLAMSFKQVNPLSPIDLRGFW